jgi:hypothetical protein
MKGLKIRGNERLVIFTLIQDSKKLEFEEVKNIRKFIRILTKLTFNPLHDCEA